MSCYNCDYCKKDFEFDDHDVPSTPPACPHHGLGHCELSKVVSARPQLPTEVTPSNLDATPRTAEDDRLEKEVLERLGLTEKPLPPPNKLNEPKPEPPASKLDPRPDTPRDVPASPPPSSKKSSEPHVPNPSPKAFGVGDTLLQKFTVVEELPGDKAANIRWFLANDGISGVRVRICLKPLEDAGERASKLAVAKWIEDHKVRNVVKTLEVHAEGQALYEVQQCPVGVSLEQWASGRTLTRIDIERLVKQLATTLKELHGQRSDFVLHLNLSPKSIFVHEDSGAIRVSLAGWDRAVRVDRKIERSIDSDDLRYLPPEAVGQRKFSFDADAQSWDWWALGRTIQELVNGSHIFAKLTTGSKSERQVHEVMLGRSRDYRPGLVEIMDPQMDPAIKLLLEGLLSSNKKARWGWSSVNRWLGGEPVEAQYTLGIGREIFTYNGQPHSPQEAAAHILKEGTPTELVHHGLSTSADDSLASYVASLKDQTLTQPYLAGSKIAEGSNANVANRYAKDWLNWIGASAFLCAIARKHGYLIITGKQVDREWLWAQFEDLRNPEDIRDAFAALKIITGKSVCDGLKALSFQETVLSFDSFARVIKRLENFDGRLIDLGDINVLRRIVDLASESPQALIDKAKAIRDQYPTSGHKMVRSLLQAESLEFEQAAVLCFGIESIESFQLVDKEKMSLDDVLAFRETGAPIFRAATYAALLFPLRVCRWSFGGFLSLAAIAAATGFLVGESREDLGVMVPLGVFAGLALIARIVGWFVARRWLRSILPDDKTLKFWAMEKTCRDRSRVMNSKQAMRSRKELRVAVEETNANIIKSTLAGKDAQTFSLETPTAVWVIGATHLAILMLVVLLSVALAQPRTLVGSLKKSIFGPKQTVAIAQTGAAPVQSPVGTLAAKPATVDFFKPSTSQVTEAAAKLFHEKITLPTFLTKMADPPFTVKEVVGQKNTYEVTAKLECGADLFRETDRSSFLAGTDISPDILAAAEALLQGADKGLPSPIVGTDHFLRKSFANGATLPVQFTLRASESSDGWTFSIPDPAAAQNATKDLGKPLAEFSGVNLFEGSEEYASKKTAFVEYARKVTLKANQLKAELALAAQFAAVQPGVSYEGVLHSNRGESFEIKAVWDTFKMGGEIAGGFIYLADRPWIRKRFTGRVMLDKLPNTVAGSIKITKGFGSQTLPDSFWTGNFESDASVVISSDGVLKATPSGYSLSAGRMANPFLPSGRKVAWSQALDTARQKALAGDELSALKLGYTFDLGENVLKDPIEAATWFETAAADGSLEAAYQVADYALKGTAGWRSTATALKILEQLSNRHHYGNASDLLGVIYGKGLYGITVDEDRANLFFRAAAEEGSLNGMANYGIRLIRRQSNNEKQEGAKWLRKAAEAGDKRAANVYALCLESGTGVARNPGEAARYRELAGGTNQTAEVGNTQTIKVPANEPWFNTGIVVKSGQRVVIAASGSVRISDLIPLIKFDVSPAGQPEIKTLRTIKPHLAPDLTASSLIGKIGLNGEAFEIGKGGEITAYSSGELYLTPNCNVFKGNSGAWDVTVTTFSQ